MNQDEFNERLKSNNRAFAGDLRGIDFSNVKDRLRHADLRETDLRGANLRGIDLREADLAGADLREADLTGIDFTGADLREANLTGAILCETNLMGADLRETKLTGADLRGANLICILLARSLHAQSGFSKPRIINPNPQPYDRP